MTDDETQAAPAPTKRGMIELQWVPPALIDGLYGRSAPSARRALYEGRHQAVLDGDWDLDVRERSFSEHMPYRGLHQRFVEGKEWKDTEYFKTARAYVNKRVAAGIVDAADKGVAIAERLAALDALHDTIARHGYKSQAQLAADANAPVIAGSARESKGYDEIRVAIDRHGRYLSVDGRHRLSIARIVGVPLVPVNVLARHRAWAELREDLRARAAVRGGSLPQRLTHPDLHDVPGQRDDLLLPRVLRALEGYDAAGKSLVDLAANLGDVAHGMALRGFRVTAVEPDVDDARLASRFRDAASGGHDVFQGKMFDVPDVDQADVVLALDGLQHLTRTWRRHDRLIEFLRRMQPEVILLAVWPPVRAADDPPFRNYSPWEFADFVSRHARLERLEPLPPTTKDGRLMFKLTRPG